MSLYPSSKMPASGSSFAGLRKEKHFKFHYELKDILNFNWKLQITREIIFNFSATT